MAPRNI